MSTTRLIAVALLSLPASLHVVPVAAQVLAAPPGSWVATDVDSAEQERVLWTAASLERLLGERDYPSVLVLTALSGTEQAEGTLDLAGLEPLVQSLAAERVTAPTDFDTPSIEDSMLAGCRQEQDASRGVLCAMERLVPLATPAFAQDLTEQGARLVGLSSQPARTSGRALSELPASVPAIDPLQSYAEEALSGAWRLREGADPGFDDVLGQIVGLAPGAGTESLLGAAPGLRGLLETYPVLGGPGVRAAGFGPTIHYQAFLDDVTSSLPSMALGAGEGADPRSQWAANRAFVYLAAQAADLSGSGRGVSDRMRVLGTAAVDLQREAAVFPSTLVSQGRDIATSVLTGNLLGIVSGITSFFGGSAGGLGLEAAREVRTLRRGIESLSSELETGFAGLDHRLDEMSSKMDALEGLVASNGRDVRRDLAALHESVLALSERIDWMDANVRSYVQAGFDREYTRTLVRCLEHRERYAPPRDEMDFDVFAECLADFRARAVVDASDALLTDQSTSLDDVSLVAALSDPSLANLSYRLPLLGRAADERFGYLGLASGHALANIVEWRIASEAYLTLLGEWPVHARVVRSGDLEAMRAVGVHLRDALQSIPVDGNSDGRATLLSRVLGYYNARLLELTAEGDSLARRHRQESLRRVAPESVLTRLGSESSGPSLDVPPVIVPELPLAVRTASVMGLDETSLEYRLSSEDSVILANPRRGFLIFGRRHDRVTYTRTAVEVELRSSALGTIARFGASGPFVLRRTEEMNGQFGSEEVRSGVEHIEDPDTHFLTFVWPALASDSTWWTIDSVRPAVVTAFEGRIEAELRRNATVGLNNVFASICSEVSSVEGLSAPDQASALRVRNALNGMSAARVLLEAYLRLALPDEWESNEHLRALVAGPESVLDRTRLCASVAQGESPLRMVWLEAEPVRRLEAARAAVNDALRPRPGGFPTMVDSTLERLDAAIRVQRLRVAVAAR